MNSDKKKLSRGWIFVIVGAVTGLIPVGTYLMYFIFMSARTPLRMRISMPWRYLPVTWKFWMAFSLALFFAGLLLVLFKNECTVQGWVLVIAGVLAAWAPVRFSLRIMGRFGISANLWKHLGSANLQFRLVAALCLLLTGLILILNDEEAVSVRRNTAQKKKDTVWQTKNSLQTGRIKKYIQTVDDVWKLDLIAKRAPLDEVRAAAAERRDTLLTALLDSGDSAAISKELSRVVQNGMYWPDFFASAAQRYPQLVWEIWPQVEHWAHTDISRHTDQKPGIHVDRTDYYDYFRYPDGRTVANRNGRRRHTDQRAGYSDCHDDRHKDSTTHTDNINENQIARFRPAIPEDQ